MLASGLVGHSIVRQSGSAEAANKLRLAGTVVEHRITHGNNNNNKAEAAQLH